MEERRAFRSERRRHNRIRKQRKAIKNKTTIQKGIDDILRSKHEFKSRKIIYPGMEEGITHKVIKGAEAQFNNRKRVDGWLTPSARQLIQMHFNAIRSVMRILPISSIIIERVCFDFQKLENQNIYSWEYSKGPLYGFKDYKDYIYSEQGRKCLLCGRKPIEYYHHIIPRHEGGSDNVKNIAGLCNDCHYGNDGVHKNPETRIQLQDLKEGLKKQYQISLLNSVMPALIEEVSIFCENNHFGFSITNGYTTSETRKRFGLPKKHCIDAYCISVSSRQTVCGSMPAVIYKQRRFKKKSNNIISKRNNREYYIKDGNSLKLVAKNRHKATEQEFPSLEEHLSDYSKTHTKYECIAHARSLIIKPCRRTYTFHKEGKISPFHPGDTVKYEKYNKKYNNINKYVFVTDKVSVSTNRVCCGGKEKLFRYCRRIQSGCTPTTGFEQLNKVF